MKLTVELVPQTAMYKNIRSVMTGDQWHRLSRDTYKKARYRCEICGCKGDRWPVECHEVWHYDDKNHTQTLVRLIALCPPCHGVKHFGHSQLKGNGDQAFLHFRQINGLSAKEAKRYLYQAFAKWRERSQHRWTLEVSLVHQLLRDLGSSKVDSSNPSTFATMFD